MKIEQHVKMALDLVESSRGWSATHNERLAVSDLRQAVEQIASAVVDLVPSEPDWPPVPDMEEVILADGSREVHPVNRFNKFCQYCAYDRPHRARSEGRAT